MGDDDLTAFYRDHYTRFFRFAWRLVSSEDKAADLVHEALTRSLPKLLPPGGAVGVPPEMWCNYLFRVIHNLAVNLMTRTREDAAGLTGEDLAGVGERTARDHAESVSGRVDVRRCLQALTVQERAAFVLAAFEGFVVREIAELLELSDDAAFRRVKSAERKLKLCLQLDGNVA